MNKGVRNTEELLVLTCNPQDIVAALDWRPFKTGNTLGEIITAHNLRCDGLLQEKTPKAFVDSLPQIKPALKIGTCIAREAGGLSADRLRRVKILLLDLDSDEQILERMEPIRKQLSGCDHAIHLVQVSRSPRPVSWAGYFDDEANILTSDPEVFTKQSEFETFLHVFREAYENGWAGVTLNPLDVPRLEVKHSEPYIHPSRGHFIKPGSKEGKSVERVYRDYRKALPNLLAGIRDVAMAQKLPADQAVNLGRTAAIQELLLTLIAERARPFPGYPLSVQPIRMPLGDMPTAQPLEMKDLQKTRLVGLRLVKRIQNLNEDENFSEDEKMALAELGIAGETLAVVQIDRQEVWEKVKPIKEILESDIFAADLPGWPMKFKQGQVALNEIAYGLNIEESRSRDMEVQYAQFGKDTDMLAENDQP
ncbi:MAG TPA: hypothetical protein VFI27_15980 [candidate division Zixibacteria bacterium]|nr:hypothetical protein [candidate division Zixibacteria bacterium]